MSALRETITPDITAADMGDSSLPARRLEMASCLHFLRREEDAGFAAEAGAGGEHQDLGKGREEPFRNSWRWAASRSICSSSSGECRTSRSEGRCLIASSVCRWTQRSRASAFCSSAGSVAGGNILSRLTRWRTPECTRAGSMMVGERFNFQKKPKSHPQGRQEQNTKRAKQASMAIRTGTSEVKWNFFAMSSRTDAYLWSVNQVNLAKHELEDKN
ncbi:hypothetical protein AMECASPLE_025997 [Ameca splendens]|uniref:Uncharacterized protein n=1 Tax=Ameca splendens TaxID=208324 RepID=A0ABV1ABZ7_9TELE